MTDRKIQILSIIFDTSRNGNYSWHNFQVIFQKNRIENFDPSTIIKENFSNHDHFNKQEFCEFLKKIN